MPKELFFVNKTPSSASLTRSQQDERARILSYVQTNRRKQEVKKASRRHAGPAGTEDPDNGRAGTNNTPTTQTMTLAQFCANEDEVPSKAIITRSYPKNNSSDPFYCTVASTDVGNHLLLHCNMYSVFRSMYLGEAFAPMSVICSTSLRNMNSKKHHHANVFVNRLKRSVEDRALMYATLAYGSTFLAWTTGGEANKGAGFGLGSGEEGSETAPSAEYFLGRALREVRMRLAEYHQTPGQGQGGPKVDPWLILSIYNLAVTEMWNGMPQLWMRFPQKHAIVVQTGQFGRQASRVHMRALQRLVGLAGGWDALGARTDLSRLLSETGAGLDGVDDATALGSYLLDSSVLSDKYLRMYEFTDPLMVLDWGPGGLPPQVFASEQDDGPFPRMGTAFAALDLLSPEVKATMDDMASYCRITHTAWSRHAERINSAMEIWLFRRLQELSVRLMILYHHPTGTTDTGNSTMPASCRWVNQCVSLAALVFLLGCTANVGAQTGANYQAARLRILLTQHLAVADQAGAPRGSPMEMDKGLKLWCLSTGALLSDKLPARTWFVESMSKLWWEDTERHNHLQGETPSEALAKALEPYLFLPDRQSEGIEDILGQR